MTTQRSDTGHLPVLHGPALIGRGPELAALAGALEGPPAVVLVEGEAGIGKTRLIGEFCASPAGRAYHSLVACCPPFRQPHTLGPVADALRQAAPDGVRALHLGGLAGALRPLFPEWAATLPPAPEPAEDATAARHRLFTAVAELLASLNVDVLVVEDVHWADEATVEFLLFWGARRTRPGSLVVTCRPEDVPAGSLLPRLSRLAAGSSGLRLMLGPLDVPATAGLMSSMLAGEHVSEQFAAFVHSHTEGIPLAVEETVRLMASRRDLARRGNVWVRHRTQRITVPPTIRDAVLERAGRLSPDARAVLQAAAVLADPAGEGIVQAVTGFSAERLRDGLAEGLDSGLLAEDTRGLVAFRHVLAARAVDEAITGPARRAMHQRAGEALEHAQPPPLARLARHFREAGDTERWCQYTEQAADLALASGDEAAAALLLHQLVTSGLLEASTVVRLAGKVPLLTFSDDAHVRSLADALGVAAGSGNLSPVGEAHARFQLGRALVSMEDFEAGWAELERAVQNLPTGSAEAARAMMLLAVPRGTTCPAPVHLRWLRRASTAAVSLGSAERLRLAVDRVSVLLILGEQSGWAEAADHIPAQPSHPRERLQVTRGHMNIAESALTWGCYGDARRRLTMGRELADRYEYHRFHAAIQVFQCHLDWLTGNWDGLKEQSAALTDEPDLPPLGLRARLVSGLLQAVAGDRVGARERLRLSLHEVGRQSTSEYAAEVSAALARLDVADGAIADALEVTMEPTDAITRKGTWIWAADLAPARVSALIAGDRAGEAAALVNAFGRGLRGHEAPAAKAGLTLCRALQAEAGGEHARAAVLYGRAAEAWQVLPRPYDALLARERQAQCLLAGGKREAGVTVLAQAGRGLTELGATGDADRVTRTLRGQGVAAPPVWRGGRRGYGDQLSPRELEVVRLILTGRTTREIAHVLCRSPDTVATQRKAAMRKLGVSSRAALVASAVSAGITPGGDPRRQSE